jgi:hypothetical protein
MSQPPLQESRGLKPPAPPIIKCPVCFAIVNDADANCAECSYPLKGSAVQQTNFIAERNNVDADFVTYNKTIKKAGNTLFYLSGIFAIGGIYGFFVSKDDPDVIIIVAPMFVLSICFLLLGEYSKKKPLACIIAGISSFIVVQILAFIGNPTSIAKGIVINCIIIVFLINGLKSALDVEKIKKMHRIQ